MTEISNNLNAIQNNVLSEITNAQNQEAKVGLTKTMENGGITNISYTNQGGKSIDGKDTKEQAMAALLSQDPEATEKMVSELCSSLSTDALKSTAKASMGVISDLVVCAKNSVETTDTKTNTTEVSNGLDGLMGKLSTFDIRDLMKLLIKAFAQFFQTQRALDLSTIEQIQAAMEAKINAMEEEKNEAYKAAMAQAIGSIVSGCMSVTAGLFSAAGGLVQMGGGIGAQYKLSKPAKELKQLVSAGTKDVVDAAKSVFEATKAEADNITSITHGIGDSLSGVGNAINGFGGIATGVTGIIGAEAKKAEKEAQIEQTKQDAVLEILKKMQNDGSEQTKQLMDFIARILSMIQELQQSAAQTEKTIVQA